MQSFKTIDGKILHGQELAVFMDTDGVVRYGTPVSVPDRSTCAEVAAKSPVVPATALTPPKPPTLRAVAAQPAKRPPKPVLLDKTVQILRYTVSAGRLGLGGVSGSGAMLLFPKPEKGAWQYPHAISAWAPSMLEIRNEKPILLAGFIEPKTELASPVMFFAAGNLVGRISAATQTTVDDGVKFQLPPGDHLLEVTMLNRSQTPAPATVWAYRIVES